LVGSQRFLGPGEPGSDRSILEAYAFLTSQAGEEPQVQHEHTEHVAASPDAVYTAISDTANLPRFVPQMIGVRPAGEDRVEVDARYEGHEQHGEASFHANPADRRIEWSAPSGYRGWMKVDPDGAGSRLTLFLETIHGSERDYDIAATLSAIRMLVESEV
jgi:hypothetical protein